jgi:ATP-dependent DNA helicase RecQ
VLWQKRDAGLLAYFIGQLTDPAEKDRAWQRYHTIRDFVESANCRHRRICCHFGENPKFEKCNACDACGIELHWLADTADAKWPVRRRSTALPAVAARPEPRKPAAKMADAGVDPELREYLREWRRVAAKQQGVPAYVVMHDTSLDELCRKRPASINQLLHVSGFGERKSEMYGQQIFDAFKRFRDGARATVETEKKPRPARRHKTRRAG